MTIKKNIPNKCKVLVVSSARIQIKLKEHPRRESIGYVIAFPVDYSRRWEAKIIPARRLTYISARRIILCIDHKYPDSFLRGKQQ